MAQSKSENMDRETSEKNSIKETLGDRLKEIRQKQLDRQGKSFQDKQMFEREVNKWIRDCLMPTFRLIKKHLLQTLKSSGIEDVNIPDKYSRTMSIRVKDIVLGDWSYTIQLEGKKGHTRLNLTGTKESLQNNFDIDEWSKNEIMNDFLEKFGRLGVETSKA